MMWEEAAALVPMGDMSKNQWKREVRKLMAQSAKESRKAAKREARGEEEGQDAVVAVDVPKRAKVERPPRDVCIVFDCSYDDLMTDKEVGSLSNQIKDSYAANRMMDTPCRMVVCCDENTRLWKELQKHPHDRWENFEIRAQSVFTSDWGDKKVMYLSSEGQEVVGSIEEGSVVVIGGLVDRNRHKGVTHEKATQNAMKTHRLPLDELKMKMSKVLTCNTVVSMICTYLESNDWEKAQEKIPQRRMKKKD